MKNFQLRNDTRLFLSTEPVEKLGMITRGKRVLFVYGGGSVKKNGCLEDVRKAVSGNGGTLYELGNVSRERTDIERGIRMAKEYQIETVIGAGGSVWGSLQKESDRAVPPLSESNVCLP